MICTKMWKKWMICGMIFTFSIFFLSACGNNEESLEENQYYVYYMNKDCDELLYEVYTAENAGNKTLNVVSELLLQLGKVGEGGKSRQAINAICKVLDYQLDQKQLTLNFDAGYQSLSTVEEVLHRAAIVKTLTQIEGVEFVEFNVDGQPLAINKTAIGAMQGEDFIDHVGGNGVIKSTIVSMYFADGEGKHLVEVPAKITYDTTIPMGQLMIEELLKGPDAIEGLERTDLQKTLPEGTVLNNLTIRDNICYVDFSKEFTNVLTSVSSNVTIYSVVNLLAELPNVNKVQFTVEGEFIDSYGDEKSMNTAFERNLDIIDSEGKE